MCGRDLLEEGNKELTRHVCGAGADRGDGSDLQWSFCILGSPTKGFSPCMCLFYTESGQFFFWGGIMISLLIMKSVSSFTSYSLVVCRQ